MSEGECTPLLYPLIGYLGKISDILLIDRFLPAFFWIDSLLGQNVKDGYKDGAVKHYICCPTFVLYLKRIYLVNKSNQQTRTWIEHKLIDYFFARQFQAISITV